MTDHTPSGTAQVTVPIGPVELRVPPDPALSQVLRLTASSIATLAGFTVEEIERITVAISEVVLALIDHGGGAPIDVRLQVDGRAFNVTATTSAAKFDPDHPDIQLTRTVLAEVTDAHGIAVVDETASIWAAVTGPIVE